MPNHSAVIEPPRDVLPAPPPSAKWTRFLLPSIADLFFLILLGILAFSPMSAALLGDADTGWHIRNGEVILSSHSVPRTDFFSYTKAGQPWYAWEWLYDAVIAPIHHVAGLNGVVLFSAVIIAATFALLFRCILRRSGNFAVAISLTLLSAAAAQIHMLARPHILSWLFTLLFLDILFRFEEGNRWALAWLPPLMLLWVNVHGGFVLGLVLLALYAFGKGWSYHVFHGRDRLTRLVQAIVAFCVCFLVTFATPYGYGLHLHVYGFLGNSSLINSINEFMSPNFHASGYGYFEALILISIISALIARQRITTSEFLLILLSIHMGLLAARNIPLSAIIISVCIAPMLSTAVTTMGEDVPEWLQQTLGALQDVSKNMRAMEAQFRGHPIVILVLALSIFVAINQGRLFSAQLMSAHFSEKEFPVNATEFIATQGIHQQLFNPDYWSGYLIYRLYPGTKVFFDDRFDFYGQAFTEEYLKAENGTWQWREPLESNHVNWVLISPKSPLASLLKESREWKVRYDDGVAIVFSRVE